MARRQSGKQLHRPQAKTTPLLNITSTLQQAEQLLKQDQPQQAINICRQTLKKNPDNPALLNRLGTIHEALNKLSTAENYLHRAIKNAPNVALYHYNLGKIFRQNNKPDQALEKYQTAVGLEPDIADAYMSIGYILHLKGDHTTAIVNFQQAIRCNPSLTKAHLHLSVIYQEIGQLTTATDHCHQAIKLSPNFYPAYDMLGTLLFSMDKGHEAIKCHQQAIKLQPNLASLHNHLGDAYTQTGQLQKARRSYQQTIQLQPVSALAHFNLANITQHHSEDPVINSILTLLHKPDVKPDDKILLQFTLGKIYNEIESFDSAFKYYLQANKARRAQISYCSDAHNYFTKSLMTLFNAELFNTMEHSGNDSSLPIFILGMPRSGTTLVEQILSAHPDIHAAGEKDILPQLFLSEFGTLNILDKKDKCTKELFSKIGNDYITELQKLAPNAKYITDKMPQNFMNLGLIALALPNAKIIHCQRDPIDTCLSCYTNFFASGHNYSYDLQELGSYYQSYETLMTFWHKMFPGKILDIQYEDVVNDLESQARRMTDYCQLPWDKSCLEFYRSKRAINTASINQVNKPIYTRSIQRWKHYEKHLQPLLHLIQPIAPA